MDFCLKQKCFPKKIDEAERLKLPPETLSELTDVDQAAVRKKFDETKAEIPKNRRLRFNALLDAGVAIFFIAMITIVVALAVWDWFSLLSRRKPPDLRESEPVFLPDYAVDEGKSGLGGVAGAAVIALGLAKELSGEAQLERAQKQTCECHAEQSSEKIYVETTEQRFNGVRRCC